MTAQEQLSVMHNQLKDWILRRKLSDEDSSAAREEIAQMKCQARRLGTGCKLNCNSCYTRST